MVCLEKTVYQETELGVQTSADMLIYIMLHYEELYDRRVILNIKSLPVFSLVNMH